ncbi:unnamed protein product, partial [Prunus brigantina]
MIWFGGKLPPNQTNREHYVLTIDLTKGSLPKRTSRRHIRKGIKRWSGIEASSRPPLPISNLSSSSLPPSRGFKSSSTPGNSDTSLLSFLRSFTPEFWLDSFLACP